MIKTYLKKNTSPKQFRFIKSVSQGILALPVGFNLKILARIYKSDKWGAHYYAKHYQDHFRKFKFKKIKLLEIGVGGYENPDIGGNSLRMWKRYFPFGRIYALDLYDKKNFEEHRIKIFRGSQTDEHVLSELTEATGELDIIIDDGSHINSHVIKTFAALFPKLKQGGIYVIEDTQTSYWPDYGGSHQAEQATIMNYFKHLTDGLNHEEFMIAGYEPSYFDRNIVSMHFYHNLIMIYKGDNNEGSNVPREERTLEPYNGLQH